MAFNTQGIVTVGHFINPIKLLNINIYYLGK